MEAQHLRIALFSRIVTGGAGHAALRVHESLCRQVDASSTLYVSRDEPHRHPGVVRLRDAEEGCQPPILPGLTMFSIDPPGIPDDELGRIIASSDVFNLHWFARFLSLRNVERLSKSGKPLILTIRDMNPLTGGCHYFHGCENWKGNCAPCPQLNAENLPVPNATLEAKRVLWDFDNITLVVLSDHTAALVENSPLFARCRVEKIPNPIDVSTFKPYERARARAEFGVPPGKHAIAYLPSFGSRVKGAAQAVETLRTLANRIPSEDCVILCAGELDEALDVPFKTIRAGFIRNKRRLARFYSAADVTLIPSDEETFSNTAAESVSCGTPIIGFQVGAIPEIAQGPRGRAAPVGDIATFADGLETILSGDRATPSVLHRFVVESFGADAVGGRYLELFEGLAAQARSRASGSVISGRAADEPTSVQRFDDLLAQYRAIRSVEMEEERSALARERRTLRGMLTLLRKGAELFFSDNAAFRSRTWSILTGRS